jgi:ribonuclease HII
LREPEKAAWKAGFERVGGVDEAGRGPLAGPVVAACVVLPRRLDDKLVGLRDSKRLSERQRESYFPRIEEIALAVGVGLAGPGEIDALNILQATFLAMRRAIASIPLEREPHFILVDGNRPIKGLLLPQKTLVGGDDASLAIAAASVIAKVTRDRLMIALHDEFPDYGFERHKGYGTKAHYQALLRLGPCAHHRQSFLKRPNPLSPLLPVLK